ncbi:hypothetical protein LDENG_00092860 [Lucifuga dentata]|nr:hypothetical protein LDENG_00092860 [Lucifuga dentata]
MKKAVELEQLCCSEDHLHLLQRFSSISSAPPTKDWTKVRVHQRSYEGNVVKAVAQLEVELRKEMEKLMEAELKKVDVKGKTDWDLGVVRDSINRKGEIRATPQEGFWTIWLRNENEYRAYADASVRLHVKSKLEKVGVFVDHEEGVVSFYDVDAAALIYSFIGCSFTEKLSPCFSPGINDGGKNSAPMIICAANHSK